MPKSKIKVQRDVMLPRIEQTRDWWLYVIAIEGERREKLYFNTVHSRFSTSRAKIDILPTLHGDSSQPQGILARLAAYRETSNLQAEDQCWLVFDVDSNSDELLRRVCDEAKQQQFNVAISNPCFEFWLFLHRFDASELPSAVRDAEVAHRAKQMKSALDQLLQGYSFHSMSPGEFIDEIRRAVARAKAKRSDSRRPYPQFPGSDVFKVVEALLQTR